VDRLFIGMDVHKEKIVVVGLPGEGSHPVLREEFNGGNLPRLAKRMKALAALWQLESATRRGLAATALCGQWRTPGSPAAWWRLA
jgi:hypothetical protein